MDRRLTLSKGTAFLSYVVLIYTFYELVTGRFSLEASISWTSLLVFFGFMLYIFSFDEQRKYKKSNFLLIGYMSVLWIGLMIRSILSGMDRFDYIFFYTTMIELSFVISYFKYHHVKELDKETTLVEYTYVLLLVVISVVLIWFL